MRFSVRVGRITAEEGVRFVVDCRFIEAGGRRRMRTQFVKKSAAEAFANSTRARLMGLPTPVFQVTATRPRRWKTGNEFEGRFSSTFRENGYVVLRNGWPDFVVIAPDGRIVFVELKRNGDGLRADQRKMHEALAAAGADVRVIRDEIPAPAALFRAIRVPREAR